MTEEGRMLRMEECVKTPNKKVKDSLPSALIPASYPAIMRLTEVTPVVGVNHLKIFITELSTMPIGRCHWGKHAIQPPPLLHQPNRTQIDR